MSSSYEPVVVDISAFLDPSPSGATSGATNKAAVADALRRACEQDGVFLIRGHGLEGVSTEALQQARHFFLGMKKEEKETVVGCKREGGFIRGYLPMFGESGRAELKELKEGFSYGYPWEDRHPSEGTNPLQGPNLWPTTEAVSHEWRPAMINFFMQMVRVSEATCRAMSLALGQDEGYLGRLCTEGDTISLMRIFHYLPLSDLPSGVNPDKAIGSSPHTDWGFLTLILQDEVGGLQVRRRKGAGEDEWVDVTIPRDTLVANCGDYLSLLSKSLVSTPFHSPVHRVVLSPDDHRISFVLFYYPNFDSVLPTGGEGEQDPGYNTFLNLASSGEGGAAQGGEGLSSFGNHLMKKWASVQRADSP